MSRRKLPAPPLVLQPVFARVRQGSPQASLLLELAHFLRTVGLLTDGGVLNLEAGLLGRNGALSLTTQDVRSWAHGMVVELWEAGEPSKWPAVAESYSARFDRGKPRRPTRLQRLFCDWSSDFGPLGFLDACQNHPRLWSTLEQALNAPIDLGPEQRLLAVALSVQQSGNPEPLFSAFHEQAPLRKGLLLSLPYLPVSAEARLPWLVNAERLHPDLASEILQACRLPCSTELALPGSLASACLTLLGESYGFCNPRWLASLRAYRWPHFWVQKLDPAISPSDAVRRIVYGARPGTFWLPQLLEELERRSREP